MKPEEQRIAIAKACGWLDVSRCSRKLNPHPEGATYRGTLDPDSINYGREYRELPDYLNDLNAMHEAEKALTNEHYVMYHVQLRSLTKNTEITSAFTTLHATARQRAAALLKTLNLWEA